MHAELPAHCQDGAPQGMTCYNGPPLRALRSPSPRYQRLTFAMADRTPYDLIATIRGERHAYHPDAPAFHVQHLVADGTVRPNDLIRPAGSRGFFLYAHQVAGLFTDEELQGVELKEDNLPPSLRGRGVRLKAPLDRK
ncbi:MAG: hypothetical protein CMJ58_12570 [Planctomycetaceae bacterium]|nr:hypothetical protein [Planctomycetaceae bacterium]